MTEEQPTSLQPSSNSNAMVSPSPAKNNSYAKTPVSPSAAKNPYLKMSPTSLTATKVLASPSPSKPSSTLTDEQRTKIEENRKRALERRVASLVEQEPNKKARHDAPQCLRCGSYDKNTLCIKWDHDGDIERERALGSGPYGWDAFRYDCCGRLAPNPCFKGIIPTAVVILKRLWVYVTWYFNVIATMGLQDWLKRRRKDQTTVGTSLDVPVIDVLAVNSSCGQMLHSIYLLNVANQVVMGSRNGLTSMQTHLISNYTGWKARLL